MKQKTDIQATAVRPEGVAGVWFTSVTSSSSTGCGNGLGTTSSTGSTPE